ncbi:MAG: hypothetical protein EDQ89_01715 [Acidobacteria bacterium]|nr:MAG: hypothetical protein EDQ89_01715 [Acidobacteriota bacterium]
MRDLVEDPRARVDVPECLRDAGHRELADHFKECIDAEDLPAALGDKLEPIASALEQAAITPGLRCIGPNVMDFATALRLYGPADARRGATIEWTQLDNGSFAGRDENGTSWDLLAYRGAIGVIVADWDRPDWYVGSYEEAKLLVEEIVARPSFPRELMEEVGVKELPYD